MGGETSGPLFVRFVMPSTTDTSALSVLSPFTKRFTAQNAGWVVNGTCLFQSFHWEISGKNGTSEKVVSFSRRKLSDELRVPFTSFTRFHQFQALHDHIMAASSTPLVTSLSSSSTLYECSVCHGLAPDFQTLLNHNCAMYVNAWQVVFIEENITFLPRVL